jgi:hypothetical protein
VIRDEIYVKTGAGRVDVDKIIEYVFGVLSGPSTHTLSHFINAGLSNTAETDYRLV